MEINILENKKNRIVFEVVGATHTFCGALKEELWEDKNVKVSTYNIDHPLTGKPKFIVETSGEEAKKTVDSAIKRLEKKIDKLKELGKKIK